MLDVPYAVGLAALLYVVSYGDRDVADAIFEQLRDKPAPTTWEVAWDMAVMARERITVQG